MATTTSALPQIAFSRNPIEVQVESDDFIAVDGVAGSFQLIFRNPVAAGFQIPLVWAAASVTLEAAAVPDESGDQFLPGASDAAYVNALIPVFEENYYIDRDFKLNYALTLGFPAIVFTSKDVLNGALYTITPNADGTVQIDLINAGVTRQLKANFAHHLEVWIKQSGTDVKIFDNNLQLDYPATGVTTKDISDILSPYLQLVTDKPDPAAITWQLCPNSLASYFIKTAQYFGDAPTVKKITTSARAFVNLGGLSVDALQGQTMAGYLRRGGVNSNALCLRQGSKLKLIQPDQPEWLYWINLTGADIDIKVAIAVYTTDGSVVNFQYAPQTALAWQKYYVGVGFTAINLNSYLSSGQLCSYYTARVLDASGNILSQTYTYVIDTFREFPRYFIYRNSLGGYQTIYTYGKGQQETDRTKTDVRKQVTPAVAAVAGGFLEANIRIQDKCTVNTGYTFKRDITLLKDFLVSPEKFYFYQGRLIPIGLSTTNQKEAKDGDNLNFSTFEFYPLYDDVVFTDDVTLPDDPNNGTGGAAGGGYNFIMDDDNNTDNLYYDDI